MLLHLSLVSLMLLSLSACQSSLPLVSQGSLNRVQAASVPQRQERETVGTAKELYIRAREMARKWSSQASLSHIEGNAISNNGKNDFPIDAVWTFSFVNPSQPILAYQVIFRSEFTRAVGQEVPKSTLKSQIPLAEQLWAVDSSTALQTASLVSPLLYFPASRVELLSVNNSPVWQIPNMAPLPPLHIHAQTGKPSVSR